MTRLILDLGEQDRFTFQSGRSRQPVALGLHADDFGMRVLGDLPDQRPAIGFGHPVFRLDLFLGIDASLERLQLLGRLVGRRLLNWLSFLVQALGIHSALREVALGFTPCAR